MGTGAGEVDNEAALEMEDVGSDGGGEEGSERVGPLTERSWETLRLLLSFADEGLRLSGEVARRELESWCLRSARGGGASEP